MGLWKDSQIAPLASVVEFAHSQGQKVGIQLAHAGRKASAFPPWVARGIKVESGTGAVNDKATGGWPVVAPSAVAYSPNMSVPRAMELDDIEALKDAFVAAAKRAITAGFDVIELHYAHGYLIQ